MHDNASYFLKLRKYMRIFDYIKKESFSGFASVGDKKAAKRMNGVSDFRQFISYVE